MTKGTLINVREALAGSIDLIGRKVESKVMPKEQEANYKALAELDAFIEEFKGEDFDVLLNTHDGQAKLRRLFDAVGGNDDQ